jgi:hypothetical protein
MDEPKAAYRRLIRRWQPDRHHGDPVAYERATHRAKEVNAAYEYLSEVLEAGLAPRATSGNGESPTSDWRTTTDSYHTRHTYQQRTYRTGFPEPSVAEVFVKSSNLVSVGYDRGRRILYAKFQGDRVYRYFAVPEQLFDDFLAAPSQGRFAHRHVYPHFKCERY